MTTRTIATSVRVQVPARINLHLSIGDRRPDGAHDRVAVMQAVDLYDELVITRAARMSVTTSGAPGAPQGARNAAGAAVRVFADRLGVAASVTVDIAKKIPVDSGLGGSSADAAGALVGCAALWGADLRRDELAGIGFEVHPGVPFALSGGTAVATGPGDRLSPVLSRTPLHWALAVPDGTVASPAVVAELDRLRSTGSPPRVGDVRELLAALASGDPARVAEHLANDLQPAAISLLPRLRETLRAGLDAGALGAVVAGAGPTVALLAADREAASRVAAELAGSGTCRSVQLASGPVPGARVVDNS